MDAVNLISDIPAAQDPAPPQVAFVCKMHFIINVLLSCCPPIFVSKLMYQTKDGSAGLLSSKAHNKNLGLMRAHLDSSHCSTLLLSHSSFCSAFVSSFVSSALI